MTVWSCCFYGIEKGNLFFKRKFKAAMEKYALGQVSIAVFM